VSKVYIYAANMPLAELVRCL